MPARLPVVDLLRALAILFVLFNHLHIRLRIAKVPYLAGIPDFVSRSLVWNGQHGVQIFFAISGFLITTTALRRWGGLRDIHIAAFYRLRFARIAPLLLLLLAVLSVLHLAGVKNFVINPKQGGLGSALLAALTFRSNVLESERGYLPGNWDILWSLSVEEMFYLFFPLAARFLRFKFAFPALLLIFMAAGPWTRAHATGLWQEYSYLGGMDAIAMGCMTALVAGSVKIPVRLMVFAGAGLMSVTLFFRLMSQSPFDDSVLALGTCLILGASGRMTWEPYRFLRPLLRLGENSYEVYLTHMFVVFGCFELFLATGKVIAAVPLYIVAILLFSGILGHLVANLYSNPLNRRLRNTAAAPLL